MTVRPFTRNPAEVQELRRFCQLWQTGTERFWAFDDVLQALGRRSSLGFYFGEADGSGWRGMILADVGPFTADLLYVYVQKEHRGEGIGRQLVTRLTDELRTKPQIEAILLEVRASNAAAQRLYVSFGMQQIDCRKSYYQDGEDALVFHLEMRRQ